MAVGAFIEVVEVVIGKSGNLADQTGLSLCVKNELEKLRNTVSTIKPTVPDAEEKQEENHGVSEWLRRLKDAVNEADNLLEEFSTEVSRRDLMTQNKEAKKVCISFPKLNRLAFDLKMGHNIKAIRKRLDDIARDMDMLHLKERLGETLVERQTHSFVFREEVIGRENDKKKIIGILLDPKVEENVAILPIVGSGGLGKTTLAKLVFNDEEIGNHFEIRLWVCVSNGFDIKRIVQKILKSAKGERKVALEISTLIDDLHQEIDGRRCLLVLDDVLYEDYEKWLILEGVLQSGARGGRILVTTRSHKFARITETNETYFLRELSPHDSWLLFERHALEEGEEPDFRIKEIGMKIVEKCRGVPLAICTLGGLLYSKRSVEEWLSSGDAEIWSLEQKENDIIPALRLSYAGLPSHLKQCFAYCSLFLKDYNINKQTLIRLWMAQGFIKLSHPNQCLEDVGHEYFMDLHSRSLFQEVEEDKRGNTSFKIHDLIHDLLTAVAGQESAVIGINREHIADAERTRHLSFEFHLDLSSLTNTLFQTSNLRTLLLCGQQLGEHENGLNESTCDAIFSHFKFLRVLDLHGAGIKTVPSSIIKLNHVRYLDLSDNRMIKMLPQSLSRL